MGDLAVYKDTDILSNVKDKIKAEFVNLIPEDKWEAMVKSAVDDWFKKRETNYNTREMVSSFDQFVQGLLKEEVKERVKAYFSSPEWQGEWKDGGETASDKMKEIIVENSDKIMATILGNAFQSALNNARQHM